MSSTINYLPTDEEAITVVEQVKTIVGQKPVLLLPILYGVRKVLPWYVSAFERSGLEIRPFPIEQDKKYVYEDTEKRKGYRPIKTPFEDILPSLPAVLVSLDDDADIGFSQAGFDVWLLEGIREHGEQDILGAYCIVDHDKRGVANFSRRCEYPEYIGRKMLLRLMVPSLYDTFGRAGLLHNIDDTNYMAAESRAEPQAAPLGRFLNSLSELSLPVRTSTAAK